MKQKITLLSISLFFIAFLQAKIIYVDASSTATNPQGTSWQDAYADLYTACDDMDYDGDTLFVAKGTYYTFYNLPSAATNSIPVYHSNTYFYGGFDGTETSLADRDMALINITNKTIVTGDIDGDDIFGDFSSNKTDNSKILFEIEADSIVFDGFTLKGAHNAVDGNSVFGYTSDRTSLAVVNCVIENNYSINLLLDLHKLKGAISFYNTFITDNFVGNGGLILIQNGGQQAIINDDVSRFDMLNCVIANNDFRSDYGLIWFREAGDGNNDPALINAFITNSTIVNNANNNAFDHIINMSSYSGNCYLDIANTIIWDNLFYDSNVGAYLPAARSVANSKTNEGNAATVYAYNNILSSNNSNVTFGDDVNNLYANPNLNPANEYAPTDSSDVLFDKGDDAKYNTLFTPSYLSLPTVDFLNNTRIQGDSIDIGAVEIYVEPSTNPNDTTNTNPSTAINTISEVLVNVYPNPTKDILNIEWNETLTAIQIYDVTGKKIKTFKATERKLNVSDLNVGIYLLELKSNATRSLVKFIKK